MNDELLCLIYELLNHRDVTPQQERLILQELEVHGCCESRIEFERRVLVRFRRASADAPSCPDRLKKKIQALLEEF